MSKNSSLAPAAKKKIGKIEIGLYIGLIILILYFMAALGAALDMSVGRDGEIQAALIVDNLMTAVAAPDIIAEKMGAANSKYAPQILFFSVIAIGIFILYKYSMLKKKLHRRGVEHGSAEWGDEKEMQSLKDSGSDPKFPFTEPQFKALKKTDGDYVYDESGNFVGNIVDNNIILTKQVYMSLNSRQHLMNLNVLIIGGSGSGKTRFYAKPNIMNLNTSFVCTDPKGEILQSVGKMLVSAGYEVRVLNTIEMEHSNNYNPFHYVYDYNGHLSEDNVTKMIDVFMQNTKGEGEKDDFWSQSAMKAITAIIFLLFEESEYYAEFDENGKVIPETRDKSQLNFYSVTAKMRKLSYPPSGSEDGYFFEKEKEETDSEYQKRRSEAFLCALDKDFIELEKRKGETLAVRLYKEIRNSPQETGQSIIATAGARTQMFNLKAVSDLTCCDNIQLETLGDKKTALFVIISATNSTYNFLAAMMYSQMFDILANRANFKYGGTLPVHVRCIMDEFANCGQIPDFDKVIAFVRSMGMSLNVIIQNLAQLKARYEKNWEVITGNCDSLLFLGGKETSTLKEISESLGKETLDIESKNRTITGGHKSDSTAESNSIVGRELMFPDEIQKMPISNCILMIRSHNPFYCNKFPIETHPNFKFTEDFDKKNAFDKNIIKAVTLQEFERSMGSNSSVKAENSICKATADKLQETLYPNGEEAKATYKTYEDIEENAKDDVGDVAGDVEEDYEQYGCPSELRSFETGEPDPNYHREEEKDYDLDDEEDDEDFAGYAIPNNEAESIERLQETEFESSNATQSQSSAIAVKGGLSKADDMSMDSFETLM